MSGWNLFFIIFYVQLWALLKNLKKCLSVVNVMREQRDNNHANALLLHSQTFLAMLVYSSHSDETKLHATVYHFIFTGVFLL